jgi:hypothetical protein
MPDLHDLAAPPPPAGFRDRLWERVAERERRDGKRRRATAAVVVVAAAAALTATGVLALGHRPTAVMGKTFDKTSSCVVTYQGGVPVFRLQAHARYRFFQNKQWFSFPAVAALLTKEGIGLGSVGAVPDGYSIGASDSCTATRQIPLSRSGLPLEGIYKPGEAGMGAMDSGAQCMVGTRIAVRVHAVVGPNDTPVSGAIAVRTGKKLRPVVYVEWTPNRVAVYMSDDCYYT